MNWSFLQEVFLGNSVEKWILSAVFMCGSMILLRLVKGIGLKSLRRLASRTPTWLDDIICDAIADTSWLLYMAAAVYSGLAAVRLSEMAESILKGIAGMTLLLQVGLWLQTMLKSSMNHWLEDRDNKRASTMAAGLTFIGKLIIWSAVSLLVLSNLGVEITTLIAGLGVGGIAVALAAQGILSDLFASLSMYLDRPFDIGDFIIVGDYLGTIEKIGLRTTRIRSISGEQIIFGNDDLVKSRIRNFARLNERRIKFGFGIEYNIPAVKVEMAATITKEVIEAIEGTRFDRVHFKEYGDYSLIFEVIYYVLYPEYAIYMDRQHQINMGLYRRFEEAGIPFAFPTSTIHVRGIERADPGVST